MRHTVTPDMGSTQLAQDMLERDDVMRTIMRETISSAREDGIREAGRTFCPQDNQKILGPAARFPTAVELARCHIGQVGVMHTHVTQTELLDPVHSLPDMANVIFEGIDASVVVGSNTCDVLVSPSDPAAAREVFSEAIGKPVSGTVDVVNAIRSGDVPNPPETRRAARAALSPLLSTHPTGFHEITGAVGVAPETIHAASPIHCGCMTHVAASGDATDAQAFDTGLLRLRINETTDQILHQVVDAGAVRDVVVGTLLTNVIIGAGKWVFYGRK